MPPRPLLVSSIALAALGGCAAGAPRRLGSAVQLEAAHAPSAPAPSAAPFAPPRSAPPPVRLAQRPGAATPAGGARAGEAARAPLRVYTAPVTVAVYEVAAGTRAVEEIARAVGGYLARVSGAEITIRVPAERFDEALRRAEGLGDLLHREVGAEDVTQEHQDLEIRIRNARATRDRLEQLLARAAKVEDAIAIERELERVARELEQLEGRIKYLADRVAFSTVTVVFSARRAEALSRDRFELPFPWLGELGLARLLDLGAREELR